MAPATAAEAKSRRIFQTVADEETNSAMTNDKMAVAMDTDTDTPIAIALHHQSAASLIHQSGIGPSRATTWDLQEHLIPITVWILPMALTLVGALLAGAQTTPAISKGHLHF